MSKELLPVIKKEADQMEKVLATIQITDEASLAQASDIVKQAKTRHKELEAEKREFTAPANEIIAAAKAKYDPVLSFLKSVESLVKGKAQVYLENKLEKANVQAGKIADRVERGTMREDTAMTKLQNIDQTSSVKTESSAMTMVAQRSVEFDLASISTDGGRIVELFTKGYLVPDMVKIRKDALAGIEIPGAKVVVTNSVRSL